MFVNRVAIAGRLVADPEPDTSTTGKTVAKFTVATTRKWKTSAGVRSETTYVPCVAWGRNAENILSFCHRGTRLYVEAHLTNLSRSPEDHQIVATIDSFQLVDLKGKTTAGADDDGGSDMAGVADDVGDVVQGADAAEASKDEVRW